MEQLGAQHHEQQVAAIDHDAASTGKNSSYLCRQSSTRWSPTSEQIRILKELYYNNGVRSPSAEQIQRISAKLRQYGKIEGKNVFYWFQNHKARERQKKRFTAHPPPPPPPLPPHHMYFNKFDIIAPPAGGNGLLTVGNYGYGPVAMEKSFRECSIGSGSTEHHHHNFTWIDSSFLDDPKRKYKTLEMEEEQEEEEIETLPLFPMHGDMKLQAQETTTSSYYNYFNDYDVSAAASLELTLNSGFPTTS